MKQIVRFIINITLFIFPISILAQQSIVNKIHLKNSVVTFLPNSTEWISGFKKSNTGPVQVLVQLNSIPAEEQRRLLGENGIQLLDYISNNVFTAVIYPAVSDNKSGIIRSITEMLPEWKADTYLWDQSKSNEKLEVIISAVNNITRLVFENKIRALGGELLPTHLESLNIYKAAVPANRLKELTSWYGIKYISHASNDIPLNFESKTATRTNLGSLSQSFGGYGLTGIGVTIGVGDNTSGITHVDLKDRIINYNPTPYTNHGVHINGITGGAGIVEQKGEGMAPAATLVDHLYSEVWQQTAAMYESHNMTLTNNSYAAVVGSCNYAGTYDIYSQAIDEISLLYDKVLHVFAAGNDGYLDCPPFPKGFATITGGYQPAKNNIVVTSTDKRFVNAIDGSRGPVKDGRLKPEITAVGVNVTSTTRSEEYLTSGGTSMACPEVTGALGLLTERYRQIHGNANPKADLLKTLILNGTTDIGNPGPDYRFGFGFMNLYRSLQMLDSNRFYTNTISHGGQQQVNIPVPPNTSQLKVMLCWHDAPASPASATQLINDLDLSVQEPSATVRRPLVLDPAPANINNNAVEGIDRRNNCEQIIIHNPAPGNYTATISGFTIPTGSQGYVLAYDFVPSGVFLTYPTTGAQVKTNDSLRIYWDASNDNTSYTLEYSADNGSNWTTISNNIPGDQRFYVWFVPGNINSGKCKMRLTGNNTTQTFTTGNFIISQQLNVQLDTIQCPGYVRIKWTGIPEATAYKLFRKIGPAMQEVDVTAATEYNFRGLSPDSFYFVAVSPVIDGLTGYRSIAVKRKPDNGNCQGNISDGDLMAERIMNPGSGRKFTSTELQNDEPVTLSIRNLDDAPCNHYRVSYSINNGPWQSQDFNDPIPGNSTHAITVGNIDMSATATYQIKLAVQNLLQADPVASNDSLVETIRHLNNQPLNLASAFTDDFESIAVVQSVTDVVGVSPNEHWDYNNSSDTGRFRSFVNTGITLNGNRSISLDAYKATPDVQNEFTGTFNLSGYNALTDEIRLEFKYLLHGRPKFEKGNEIWIRGNDTQEWQSIYSYDTRNIGVIQTTGTLSVTDGLRKTGQDYSSSFQVKIGQHDSSLIASKNYGNGLTLDDFTLYTVQNDAQLIGIVTPKQVECGAGNNTPLVISIRNGVNQIQNHIQVNYQLNNGPVVTETLSSIGGKQTLLYTFKKGLDIAVAGQYVLNVWINAQGDTYRDNDSILQYKIHNQTLITSYPYFENFESGNGNWYTEGQNSSWEYGAPQSPKINKAYSGTKAWKTNLDGNYNDNEHSFLYSPCFDISKISNPTLRFRAAMDIEYCGAVLCDAAYMEYSIDGTTWTRLDDMNKGINWYNDTLYRIWSIEGKTDWHEASTPLPKGKHTIRLRYALTSDPASTREGLAVDDIEVFDNRLIAGDQVVSISPNPTRDGKIKIVWAADAGTEMKITMTDVVGRIVYRTSITAEESYNESTIQTTRFMSGIYLMRIDIGDKTSEHKIVYQ